jgi:2-polyprenyl-3-methyl-5-hydroxy-6-metoxy-1,4-benzoquinol methylase
MRFGHPTGTLVYYNDKLYKVLSVTSNGWHVLEGPGNVVLDKKVRTSQLTAKPGSARKSPKKSPKKVVKKSPIKKLKSPIKKPKSPIKKPKSPIKKPKTQKTKKEASPVKVPIQVKLEEGSSKKMSETLVSSAKILEQTSVEQRVKNHIEFCSWVIKYSMLDIAVKLLKTKTLLDLACGRGNDLNRWISMKLQRVIGVDDSNEQISEAIHRYKSMSSKIKVNYINMSVCAPTLPVVVRKYYKDPIMLATCNFALNHFVNDDGFYRNISRLISPGGLLVGTAADGDYIEIMLNLNDGHVKSDIVDIKRVDDERYTFKINSPFFNSQKVVVESLVKRKEFVERMAKYGFEPYLMYHELPAIFNFADFPNELGDPELKKYYMGFCFIKVDRVSVK